MRICKAVREEVTARVINPSPSNQVNPIPSNHPPPHHPKSNQPKTATNHLQQAILVSKLGGEGRNDQNNQHKHKLT